MKSFTIEAQVHQQVKEGYRVKISVLNLGFHINGALVFPPNDKHEDWVVYPPAIPTRFKRIYPIEFDKKQTLWLEIVEAAVNAVKQFQHEGDPMDDVEWDKMSPEEFNQHLSDNMDKTLGQKDPYTFT